MNTNVYKTIGYCALCLFCILCDTRLPKGNSVLTDFAGRRVTIPEEIKGVVALSASLRYVVYLQAFDKVVGVEELEQRNSMRAINADGRMYWAAIADRVDGIPGIGEGGPGKLPDFERLLVVKPDIVFTFEANNAEIIQGKTGIPCIVISGATGMDGFSIDDIKKTFLFMGNILGKQKRALELSTYIDTCITDLQRRVHNTEKVSVYVGGVSARGAHGITSTESFYPPLQWLNVLNVVDELGKKGHLFIDVEKLIVWDCDYLFIDAAGLALIEIDYKKNSGFYKKLKAVVKNNVYTVYPYNFYRTNIEVMIANSYFIGKTLYREQFNDIDIEEKAREIVKQFVGMDVYDNLKKSYKGYGKVKFTNAGLTVH